jgi:hypothetical protein
MEMLNKMMRRRKYLYEEIINEERNIIPPVREARIFAAWF